MIKFETDINRDLLGRRRLVIRSSHNIEGGKLKNMFVCQGNPMLDVADAIDLREILDRFIKNEAFGRVAHHD